MDKMYPIQNGFSKVENSVDFNLEAKYSLSATEYAEVSVSWKLFRLISKYPSIPRVARS